MKKDYKPTDPEENKIEDPASVYEITDSETDTEFYDIPKDYLLKRIEIAEKEIAEGKGIPFEEIVKRFLG